MKYGHRCQQTIRAKLFQFHIDLNCRVYIRNSRKLQSPKLFIHLPISAILKIPDNLPLRSQSWCYPGKAGSRNGDRQTNCKKTDLVWFECKFHWNELAVRDASSGNQHADSDMTKCIVLIKRKKVHCSCMTRSTASPSDLQVEQTTGGVVERIWAKIFGKHLESEFPCVPCVFASLRVPLLDIDLKMA